MAENIEPEMTQLDPPEKSRTYVYADGTKLTYEDVRAICVRSSGTHRLELGDGRKVIVTPGWIAVELVVGKWTL